MSTVDIRAALETRLNGMTPSIATAFENVPYTPVTGTPYQRVYLKPGGPENPSIGSAMHRDIGVFWVTLFYPPNAGSQAAIARAELIRARFQRGLTVTSGSTVVHVTTTPEIDIPQAEADRYVVNIKVRYHVNVVT